MNKTQSKIVEILGCEENNIDVHLIMQRIGVSYETAARNLKLMVEMGIVEREVRKNCIMHRENGTMVCPQVYLYKIKNRLKEEQTYMGGLK